MAESFEENILLQLCHVATFIFFAAFSQYTMFYLHKYNRDFHLPRAKPNTHKESTLFSARNDWVGFRPQVETECEAL